MIGFRIDRRSGTAVYAQLVQQVRQAVRTGRLVPGDRLPTAREVAERNGINPNTVLRAYRDLEVAGLVEPRQGSGTFVSQVLPRPQLDVTALRRELADWVDRAHAAGLDQTDIDALVADVSADRKDSHAHQ
ncbi:GntR family transcriptional regulator [Actinoplanes sp. NPDC051346]|uniref:GntR family transcriptional regulator n=1 Tax=Actinoplanes sp. NPDC051346 TaxID=3155048 RepID=UPI00342973FB